ncbi:MAG: hypothetical protein ABIG66_01790 [Candidatus Kerfeldbacteria bacterium]
MITCPQCEYSNNDNANVCRHCGLEFTNTIEEHVLYVTEEKEEDTVEEGVKTDTELKKGEAIFGKKKFEKKDLWKLVWIIPLLFLGLYFWYIVIPILMIWFVWKRTWRDSIDQTELTAIVLLVLALGVFHFVINRAPTVTITEPADGIVAQDRFVTFKGKVSPAKSLIYINNLEVPVDNGEFVYDYELTEGTNPIDILAVNNHFFASFGVHGTAVLRMTLYRELSAEELAEQERQAELERLAEEQRIREEEARKKEDEKKKEEEEQAQEPAEYADGRVYFDNLIETGQIGEYEIDEALDTVWVYLTSARWANIGDQQAFLQEMYDVNAETFGLRAVSVHNIKDFNEQFGFVSSTRLNVY